MTPSSARERRIAYLAWVTVCIIWGTTYLGIRISLESIPPALMGGLRWTMAGALLASYAIARGHKLPRVSSWGGIAVLGFLLLALGNGGVVYAEQWITSGLAAVLVGTSPFWMAGVEAFMPGGERLTSRTIVGLSIGFLGIVVLVWPELNLGDAEAGKFLAGVVALQIASLGWSLGSSYSRRRRDENVLGTTALQMLAGGLMMIVAGTIRGEWSSLFFTDRTTVALVYLSTVGAVGGFVAYTYALRHLPVSFVSLYAYINPIIAVALGVFFLSEPFTARMAIAAALVFAGIAVVRLTNAPARGASASVAETAAPAREPVLQERRRIA